MAQKEIMSLLSVTRQGRCISVLHDLNQLCKYCSRLALLNNGTLVAEGPTCEVFTTDNLRLAFGLEIDVIRSNDRLHAII